MTAAARHLPAAARRRLRLRAGARARALPARPRRQPPLPAAVVPGARGLHARLRRGRPDVDLARSSAASASSTRWRARSREAGHGADPRHRPQPHGDRRRQPLLDATRTLRRRFFDLDEETGRHRRFFDIDHLAAVRQEDEAVFEETHRLALALVREGDGRRAADRPSRRARRPGRLPAAAARGRRAPRVGGEDPRPRRAAARLARRGHGRLRVPQRRGGAVRRPGGRGAADRAVGGDLRRPAAVRARRPTRRSSSRRARRSRPRWSGCAREAPREVGGLERALASLPVYRTYVEPWSGRVDRRGPRGDRGGRAAGVARARAALGGARLGRVRHALPADDAADHGQGRRGHRVLPLRAAAGAQRRRRRPGALRHLGRATSTRPTASARSASRTTCSSPRRTTPSARATCARASARCSAMPDGVGGARAALARADRRRSRRAPDDVERYFVFQTLVGAWPIEPERLEAYMEKALREAKRTTNWVEPDEEHEARGEGVLPRALRARGVPGRLRAVRRRGRARRRPRRARPAAAQAHRARRCPTSTRATSCSRSRWWTPTTAGRSTGSGAARCSTRSAAAPRRPTRRASCG